MAYNDAQKRATIKYMAENLEEIRFRVKKGIKDKYQSAADQAGQSLTAYIKQAIEERIQRDQVTDQPAQPPVAPVIEDQTPAAPATDQATEPAQEQPQRASGYAHIQQQYDAIEEARQKLLAMHARHVKEYEDKYSK